MRYQNEYVWLIFVSAMDVIMTWGILFLGGLEVNPIASRILENNGFGTLIVYKFALVMFVIIMCEIIGRKRDRSGRRLSRFCIGLTAVPVAWSVVLLFNLMTHMNEAGASFAQ